MTEATTVSDQAAHDLRRRARHRIGRHRRRAPASCPGPRRQAGRRVRPGPSSPRGMRPDGRGVLRPLSPDRPRTPARWRWPFPAWSSPSPATSPPSTPSPGTAFWLRDAGSAWFLYQKLLFIMGGMLIPLEALPDWLHRVALVLPFRAMSYAPARLASGHFEPVLIVEQLGWLVAPARHRHRRVPRRGAPAPGGRRMRGLLATLRNAVAEARSNRAALVSQVDHHGGQRHRLGGVLGPVLPPGGHRPGVGRRTDPAAPVRAHQRRRHRPRRPGQRPPHRQHGGRRRARRRAGAARPPARPPAPAAGGGHQHRRPPVRNPAVRVHRVAHGRPHRDLHRRGRSPSPSC